MTLEDLFGARYGCIVCEIAQVEFEKAFFHVAGIFELGFAWIRSVGGGGGGGAIEVGVTAAGKVEIAFGGAGFMAPCTGVAAGAGGAAEGEEERFGRRGGRGFGCLWVC